MHVPAAGLAPLGEVAVEMARLEVRPVAIRTRGRSAAGVAGRGAAAAGAGGGRGGGRALGGRHLLAGGLY